MAVPIQYISDDGDCPTPDLVSVSACDDGMYAASFGNRVFRRRRDGTWSKEDRGLGDGIVVNRLQSIDGSVYACTNQGLYYRHADRWHPTEIAFPCYQIRKQGGLLAAATEYGVWCKVGTQWGNVAYANVPVYDLLLAPQFFFLGTNQGVSLYDRYTDSTADFPIASPVTSMAVFQGRLLGASSEGELVAGDRRGGFSRTGFDGIQIFSLQSTETDVFVCSGKGLYRLCAIGDRLTLRSVLVGFPVTDLIGSEDGMYVATLFGGLKKVIFR